MKGRNETADFRVRFQETLRLIPEALLKRRIRLALAADIRPVLGRLPCPTLVIHGRQDKVVWPIQTRLFRKAKPDCRIVLLDGPHMVLQSSPAQVADAIKEFLKAVSEDA
jgi:pimeloyl-ACP methyl ester carboxylesterase